MFKKNDYLINPEKHLCFTVFGTVRMDLLRISKCQEPIT